MVWYCFSLNHYMRRQCRCTGPCKTLQDGRHRAGQNPSLPDHSCPGFCRELGVYVRVHVCIVCMCACACALRVSPCPLTCCVQWRLGSCCRDGAPDRCRGTIKEASATGKLDCIQAPPGSSQMVGAVCAGVPPRSGSWCDLVTCSSPAGSLQPGATTTPTGAHRHGQEASRGNEGPPPIMEMCLPLPQPQPLALSWPFGRWWICWVPGSGLHPGHTCLHRCTPLNLTQLCMQVLGRDVLRTVTPGEKGEGAA